MAKKKKIKNRAKKSRQTAKKKKINRRSGKPRKRIHHRPVKAVFSTDQVDVLIARGRQRGFVTESEILQFFPYVERDIQGLEGLYRRLEQANVKVVEAGDLIESLPTGETPPVKDKDCCAGWIRRFWIRCKCI